MTTNYKQFHGPGFRLEIPTDWFITASPQFQAVFLEPSSEKMVQSNLSISIRPVKPEVTAKAVAESTLTNQQEQYPDFREIEKKTLKVFGHEAVRRSYTWKHDKKGVEVIQTQQFLVIEQMLFTITSTCQKDTSAKATDKIFQHMIETFELN